MEWPALKRLVQKQYDGLSIEVQVGLNNFQ